MHGSAWHDMLCCIRCGACLNHCPVYSSIGGHAYGWVYSGPMGKVLTPLLAEASAKPSFSTLAHASSFCGRCVEVCPVGIPLTSLMRKLRESDFRGFFQTKRLKTKIACATMRLLFAHPRMYRLALCCLLWLLRLFARRGHISYLPLASSWTSTRDLPINRRARPAIALFTSGYAFCKQTRQVETTSG